MTTATLTGLWSRFLVTHGTGGRYEPLPWDQIEAAERQLGFELPDDLVQTYLHADLANRRSGLRAPGLLNWFALRDVVYWHRALNWMVARRLLPAGELGALPDADPSPGQTVRRDRWNRGWIPVGHCRSQHDRLCIDLAPGPAGTVGQVVVVPDVLVMPGQQVADAYRVLAPSWCAYLAQLSGVPAASVAPVPPVERQRASPGAQPVNASGQPERDEAVACVVAKAWADRVPATKGVLPLRYARLMYEDTLWCEPLDGLREACQRWAIREGGSQLTWVLGERLSGKTTLVRSLAHTLLSSKAKGRRWPLVIDLADHPGSADLPAVLEAHARQSGAAAGEGAILLRAVQRGQAVLLLDNLHTLDLPGGGLRDWLQSVLQPGAARVLAVGGSEGFRDAAEVWAIGRTLSASSGPDLLGRTDILFMRGIELASQNDRMLPLRLLGKGSQAAALHPLLLGHTGVMQRLAHRPGLLAHLTLQKSVFPYSDIECEAPDLALVAAWTGWVATHAAEVTELTPEEFDQVQHRLAQALTAPQGMPRPPRAGTLDAIVRSLRPAWPPVTVERTVVQLRRALLLWRESDGGDDFLWPSVTAYVKARPMALAMEQGRVSDLVLALEQARGFDWVQARWVMLQLWWGGVLEPATQVLHDLLSQAKSPLVARRTMELAAQWHHHLGELTEGHCTPAALWPTAPQWVQLAGADLRGMVLGGLPLAGAMLDGALLDGAWLVGTDLSLARLRGASAEGTNFGGANLNGADATGLVAPRSQWEDAQLEGTVLRQAQLPDAMLEGP